MNRQWFPFALWTQFVNTLQHSHATTMQWLAAPQWANIVHTLLHTLWQAAAIAALLGIALRNLRDPVARYRCALTALVAVVLAGLMTWAVLNRPAAPPVAEFTAQNQTAVATATDKNVTVPVASSPLPLPPSTAGNWTTCLAVLWLAGATLMLARAAIQISGAERLRRSARPLDDARIAALLAEARHAVGLARRVQITVTDKLTSPAVVGVIVPTLVLPLSLITALTPEQLRFVLLHELAHIRRGDYFASLFQLLTEALLFFNPAVWWISHHIKIEREACCDALAVELSRSPADYARTLVRVAETALTPLPHPALAFGDQRQPSSLADRVQRMLVPGYRPKLRLTWRASLATLLAAGGLLYFSAIGTRIAVAAVLSPQQRMDRIEKKMAEYGEKPGAQNPGGKGTDYVTVVGHIRTEDGSPLPRRNKILLRSRQHQSSTTTAVPISGNGALSMTMTPGQIWIELDVPGYAPFLAGPFDGYATNRIDAGDLVLRRGFPATLHLSDFVTGAPISGAAIHPQFIGRESGDYFQPSANGISDQAGNITLSNCADQTLAVSVNAPGYEVREQKFTKLGPGDKLEVKLHPGASISGTVMDRDTGLPITDAAVRIMYEKGLTDARYDWNDEIHRLAKTDASGHFTANQFHRGSVYWLGVSAPGHESVIVPKVLPDTKNLEVKLGPELVVHGHVIGNLDALTEYNDHRNLESTSSEVIENNSDGVGGWVPIEVTNQVATFVFTNRIAGQVTLTGGHYRESRDITAPLADWVVDLSQTKAVVEKTVPTREVVFRFTHPPGVQPRGTVSVTIPDNLDRNHATAHYAELELTNSEVHAQIAIGGGTSVQPSHLVGYWFDRWGENGSRLNIPVTDGPGPLVVEIPLVPAGAIYARVRNADGSPASGVLFGLHVLKVAPGLNSSSTLDLGGQNGADNTARNWVSGPLPLGGTYLLHAWRGNSFAVSKPIELTKANPDADVEMQFVPGKSFDGVVLGPDGKPLADATVSMNFTLEKDYGFGLTAILTDERGRFHFDEATPEIGGYSLQIDAPGLMAQSVKLDFAKQPQTIRVKHGLSLAGKVVEAKTGYLLPGARVTVVAIGHEEFPSQQTVTDANGRFAFDTLGAVNYTLFAGDGQPVSEKTYYPDAKTNIVVAIKLYEWSKIKPVPPPSPTPRQKL